MNLIYFFTLLVPLFTLADDSQKVPNFNNKRIELALTGLVDKYIGIGQRVVFYLNEKHGLVLEQNSHLNLPLSSLFNFTGLNSSIEEIKGSSKGVSYRYLTSSNFYFQLGYQENLLNYVYTDCTRNCASPLFVVDWGAKIKSSNFVFGYMDYSRNTKYLFTGFEIGLSKRISSTVENEKSYSRTMDNDDEAALKMNESKDKLLTGGAEIKLLAYIGLRF